MPILFYEGAEEKPYAAWGCIKRPKKKQHQPHYLFRSALGTCRECEKWMVLLFFFFSFLLWYVGARSWCGVRMQGCRRRRVTQIRMGNPTCLDRYNGHHNNHACGGGEGARRKRQIARRSEHVAISFRIGQRNKWARKHYSISGYISKGSFSLREKHSLVCIFF